MQFHETRLRGAFLIDLDRREDGRGHFARTYCEDEFAAVGIRPRWVQCNVSFNRRRGTLRGLHYQEAPFAEAKLIRCTRGIIFDVIVDLRPGSPTYGKWVAAELSADNGRMFYVPEGFAHGFQTLADDTEVFYQMSERYRPEAARGVRWDDAALAIAWPDCGERIISPRDLAFPGLPPCRPS